MQGKEVAGQERAAGRPRVYPRLFRCGGAHAQFGFSRGWGRKRCFEDIQNEYAEADLARLAAAVPEPLLTEWGKLRQIALRCQMSRPSSVTPKKRRAVVRACQPGST